MEVGMGMGTKDRGNELSYLGTFLTFENSAMEWRRIEEWDNKL